MMNFCANTSGFRNRPKTRLRNVDETISVVLTDHQIVVLVGRDLIKYQTDDFNGDYVYTPSAGVTLVDLCRATPCLKI